MTVITPRLKPGDKLRNGATVIACRQVKESEWVVLAMVPESYEKYVVWRTHWQDQVNPSGWVAYSGDYFMEIVHAARGYEERG